MEWALRPGAIEGHLEMIDPTADDIGRTVRLTPVSVEPGLTGTIFGFNSSWVSVQFTAGDGSMLIQRSDPSWEP